MKSNLVQCVLTSLNGSDANLWEVKPGMTHIQQAARYGVSCQIWIHFIYIYKIDRYSGREAFQWNNWDPGRGIWQNVG